MERTYRLDVESGGLLEERLRLRTILADDADVVTTGFAVPAFRVFDVVRAELAETVGGEKNLIRGIIGYHHFRPMHHRSGNERELVLAEVENIALLHDQPLGRD